MLKLRPLHRLVRSCSDIHILKTRQDIFEVKLIEWKVGARRWNHTEGAQSSELIQKPRTMLNATQIVKIIIIRFAGLCLAIPLACLQMATALLKGKWSEMMGPHKERLMSPKILNDPKWGEHSYVHVPGVRLHIVEKGEKDKPLMLFIHGFPEMWFSWRYQMDYFSKRGFRCVAFDMRGYGFSEKPSSMLSYHYDYLVGDVVNLIKALGYSECVLVAHDWGGAIGFGVASNYPEMVRTYIPMNISHPAAFNKVLKGNIGQILKSWYMLYFQAPLIPEIMSPRGDFPMLTIPLGKDAKQGEEEIEAYKYIFNDARALEGPINYYRAAFQLDFGQKNEARNVDKVPVLQIFGTGDKYISLEAEKAADDFVKDITHEYLEGVSHWCMVQEPERVNSIMENYLKKRKFI